MTLSPCRYAVFLSIAISAVTAHAADSYPILFLTPVTAGDAQRSFTDSSDRALDSARHSLDLCIRYADGKIRNLTAEAGFAERSADGLHSIVSLKDPAISWDGDEAVFSMKLKSAVAPEVFQLYRVTGLEEGAQTTMEKIPHQPEDRDNTSPLIDADGTIFFASSSSGVPAEGSAQLGVWRIQPDDGQASFVKPLMSGPFKLSWNADGAVDVVSRFDAPPANIRIVRRVIAKEWH
jgi:hypothetical protein